MATAVDGLVAIVVVHPRDASTEPAANFPREEVLAAPLSLGVAALGGVELAFIDQGGMDAGVPLAGVLHLTEIGPIEADAADGGVLDAYLCFDPWVTRSFGAKGEDALHERGHLVWFQVAVHHVVARGCVVLPASALRGLALTHLRVLDDLVPVVLGEDARDADLHFPRCAGEVEIAFVDGMHRDGVLTEQLHQASEVTLITAEPIPAPHEEVTYRARFDKAQQFAHGGTLKILARPAFIGEHRDRTEITQAREVATPLRLGVGGELDLVFS